MFWIIFLVVLLVVCTGFVLLVRSRNGGGNRGEVAGVDNHNALQNGSAAAYRQNISGRAGPSK